MHAHSVKLYDHANHKWEEWTFEPSYDQMYLDEIDHFFDCVARKAKPNVDLRDGYRVQRVIDACARSSDTGRWVDVD
jgi:predicted dehydrogenase